jgi:glutaredoxin
MGGITYPLLSDFYPHGGVAQMYGVLRTEGYSERAIFVIDRSCTIRYVDVHDIDLQPDNEVLFRVLAEVEGVPYAPPMPPSEAAGAQVVAAAEDVDVIMYCTQWCPACRRARAYFLQHGIRYKEIDIARDREAAKRVRSLANGHETTPTFEVKGAVVVDFIRSRLNELLGIEE